MKKYKYLLRLPYWESYYCWKLSSLCGASEYVRTWWHTRLQKIVQGEI